MLMNSLDPDVAENPEALVASSATGKMAADWQSFEAIAGALRKLAGHETLLVRSGKPAGIFCSNESASRVVVRNPRDAADFRGEEKPCDVKDSFWQTGGQTTRGSWTYVGDQGILQTTYETFVGAAKKHFGGELAGKLIVSGGMGGNGGAQPLAATMNGAAFLGVDIDPERIKRRLKAGYCQVMVSSLDEALRILKNAVRKREAASVGLVANCADVIPEMAQRGVVPDLLIDQTGTQEPVDGYVPNGMALEAAQAMRDADPAEYRKRALGAKGEHARGMRELQKLGTVTIDFGNNIYLQPIVQAGYAPVCWVALSGEASDIARADRLLFKISAGDEHLQNWIKLLQKRVRFQGLPARVCWLGQETRAKFAVALNDLVARGELQAPMIIACDRARLSTTDGTDTGADSEQLESLLAEAKGATFLAIGPPVRSVQQITQACVADGTVNAGARIEQVLGHRPGPAAKL
ncbi:MAG: urocanate hydratase [Candidatus Acidiferrum sp.]